jgi:hypothetical protein
MIQQVKREMSCLFDSLSSFVDIPSSTLRQVVVEFLRSNPCLIDNVPFRDMMSWDAVPYDRYLDHMTLPSTWGGAIEIQAFAQLFHARVEVRVNNGAQVIEFFPQKTSVERTVSLMWTGNHFAPHHPKN